MKAGKIKPELMAALKLSLSEQIYRSIVDDPDPPAEAEAMLPIIRGALIFTTEEKTALIGRITESVLAKIATSPKGCC